MGPPHSNKPRGPDRAHLIYNVWMILTTSAEWLARASGLSRAARRVRRHGIYSPAVELRCFDLAVTVARSIVTVVICCHQLGHHAEKSDGRAFRLYQKQFLGSDNSSRRAEP